MTRQEFLESLERHLRGQLSESQLRGHVEYYRDYIDKEIASGKTESEVLNVLGDPWLIAKTLINSGTWSSQGTKENYVQEDGSFEKEEKKIYKKLDLTTWYGKLVVIVAAALILFLLITIIGALIPVVLLLAAVGVIVKAFQRRR